MRPLPSFMLIAAVALFATTAVRAADPTPPATNPAGTVAAGDLVEVTVYDLVAPGQGTALEVRVDNDGRIRLPGPKGLIPIGGKTNDAAAAAVSQAYQDAQLIMRAVVNVKIRETADQAKVKPGPLGVGDTLKITIFDLTAPGSVTHIDAQIAGDGTITAPVAGPVKLTNLTEANAAEALVSHYRDKQIMTNAMISVLRTAVTNDK